MASDVVDNLQGFCLLLKACYEFFAQKDEHALLIEWIIESELLTSEECNPEKNLITVFIDKFSSDHHGEGEFCAPNVIAWLKTRAYAHDALKGEDLSGCQLTFADLSGLDLSKCIFGPLEAVALNQAIVDGADFTQAKLRPSAGNPDQEVMTWDQIYAANHTPLAEGNHVFGTRKHHAQAQRVRYGLFAAGKSITQSTTLKINTKSPMALQAQLQRLASYSKINSGKNGVTPERLNGVTPPLQAITPTA